MTWEYVFMVRAMVEWPFASSRPIDPREDEPDDNHQGGGDRDDQKQVGH